MLTYQSTRPPQDALRRRLRELAAVRVSYGYRRLHTVLRREGWAVNPKRIYRLYCAEELQLRARIVNKDVRVPVKLHCIDILR